MFYTTSCRGHKITVICGFTVVSHVHGVFQWKFIVRPALNVHYKAAMRFLM